MNDKLKKIPIEVKQFLKAISQIAESLNVKAYIVGGVVRDMILGKSSFDFDIDIVVEGDAICLAQRFAFLYHAEFRKHHAFGTATVFLDKHKIDFATARRETYSKWGVLPKVSSSTLEDDLFRRDFTINSMAISINKSDYGSLIDSYGGLKDLKKGLIRVLHDNSFLDDATRLLRAIRFNQRFSFRIEKHTFNLMKEAIAKGAIACIHPHRLRDEIILLLEEDKPYLIFKKLSAIKLTSFISKKFSLGSRGIKLLKEIERSISFYRHNFNFHRHVEDWDVYLIACLINLDRGDIEKFLTDFDFKKSQRIKVLSAKDNLGRIKTLNGNLNNHQIYNFLNELSFETIIFFYAYNKNKNIRKNIKLFLGKLVHVRLLIKGDDLKQLNIKPDTLYGRIMDELLNLKLDGKLKDKNQELSAACDIFHKLARHS